MELFKLAKLDDCNSNLDKTWFVYYFFLHPETGNYIRYKKYISNRLKTKATRYDKAKEIIRSLNTWLKKGGNPFNQTAQFTKVDVAIDYVYAIKKASLRPRSYGSYNTIKEKFKIWLKKSIYSNITIEEFSYYHAQKFMDWILVNEKIQNRTYNNYLSYMRILFNTLIEREYIIVNPFSKVKMFPKTQTEIRNFSQAEMITIRNDLYNDNNGLWLACQFIYYCFIRPAELIQIKIGDIDLQKKEIYIRPEISKNRKSASLPIPDAFVDELLQQGLFKNSLDNYVFSKYLKPGKQLLYHNTLAREWRKWADLKKIYKDLYDFKHTGIGRALDQGININDLRMQLRHSSLTTTQMYLEKFRAIPGEKLRKDFPRF